MHGLLLSDAIYDTLTNNVLFVTPVHAGPFVTPAGGTGLQIDAAKDVWKDLCSTFQICHAIEQALIATVVEIIDMSLLQLLIRYLLLLSLTLSWKWRMPLNFVMLLYWLKCSR